MSAVRSAWSQTEAIRVLDLWKRRLKLPDYRHYRRGSELFVSGTSHDAAYLIVQGIVALYYPLTSGQETLFLLAYPGELVNSSALDTSYPETPSPTGSAVTNCIVYRIDARLMEAAERDDSEIVKMFNRALQKSINKRTQKLIELKTLPPAERLRRNLCELAQVLGFDVTGKPVRVWLPLKDAELAMLLGLSERQFKRVKKSFQEDGKVRVDNSRAFVLPEC